MACVAGSLRTLEESSKRYLTPSLYNQHHRLCILEAYIEEEQRRNKTTNREWPQYCRKVYWTKMAQNGQNDHFGQNALIPNRILVFARPKWTILVHFGLFWPKEVHFGPFRSANRTLAILERNNTGKTSASHIQDYGPCNSFDHSRALFHSFACARVCHPLLFHKMVGLARGGYSRLPPRQRSTKAHPSQN